jgi:hypothetical protein
MPQERISARNKKNKRRKITEEKINLARVKDAWTILTQLRGKTWLI